MSEAIPPIRPLAGAGAADEIRKEPLIQIAPMLDFTDYNQRSMARMLTKHAQLWTEMIVDNAAIHHARPRELLYSSPDQHPIVCQLGGSNEETLATAAGIVKEWGYTEVNLNVGCPSTKVAQKGCFGAALMKTPEKVRDLVREMGRKSGLPVTVKTRIGVDNLDSDEFLHKFVSEVAAGGVEHFIIHARKAWLKGLNPAANRTVPLLQYRKVYELCKKFPDLKFSLNGGIESLEQAYNLLHGIWSDGTAETESLMKEITQDFTKRPLTGVMIGRAAMNDPLLLATVDTKFYGATADPPTSNSRRALLEAYMEHIDRTAEEYSPHLSAHQMMRPIFGLFRGSRGNRIFRQRLDENIRRWTQSPTASRGALTAQPLEALNAVEEALSKLPAQRDSVPAA